VPVAPAHADVRDVADDLVALARPEPFGAVGRYYRDFSPTTDAEVVALLNA
jgi:putative phosphoribosyl transferase